MKQVFREWADASADYELAILTAEVPIDTFLGLQERALAARARMEDDPLFMACGPEHQEAIQERDKILNRDPRWRKRLVASK